MVYSPFKSLNDSLQPKDPMGLMVRPRLRELFLTSSGVLVGRFDKAGECQRKQAYYGAHEQSPMDVYHGNEKESGGCKNASCATNNYCCHCGDVFSSLRSRGLAAIPRTSAKWRLFGTWSCKGMA